MRISYDATDWKQQYDSSPAKPASMDDAIDLMRESNVKPGELAMLLIVGRELGIVKDPNVPTSKISTLTGMAKAVSDYRSRQTAKVTINGKQVEIPRFVSTVTIEEGEEVSYQATVPSLDRDVTVIEYNDQAAADRAIAYLMSNVTGRIRDRLAIVAVNRPKEIGKVVKELKRAIDEIAAELK